jgi:translation initiation factor IF-2
LPIRIYALAKDLNFDSKELVEICAKAGVTGKGSALASLSDEEESKVREYLAKKSEKKAEPAAEAPIAPIKPTAPEKKSIKTLGPTPRKAAPTPPPAEEPVAPSASTPPAEPAAPQPVESSTPSSAPAPLSNRTPGRGELADRMAGKSSERPRGETMTRGNSIPPRGGKIKVLGGSKRGDDSGTKEDESRSSKPQQKTPVRVNLAAMPKAPEAPKGKQEPTQKTQKPIMTLPKDTIRNVMSGGGPAPLDHLTKSKKDDPKKGGGSEDLRSASAKSKKRGKTAKGEEDDDLAKMSGARQIRKNRLKGRRGDDDDSTPRYRSRRRKQRKGENTAAPRKENVVLELPCTVRSFSEASGVPVAAIQKTIMTLANQLVTINEQIDAEMARFLGEELGVEVEFKEAQSLEDTLMSEFELEDEDPADLVERAPVVTFLGHVDHGKTSLLDKIIGIDVVSGEAGGITQHIRAYRVTKGEKSIAFVDTPGHEAFTEMRARGANVTDICVLIIAADDGVMPQTQEAISHAKAAGVPIVVAMNKIDLPGADENKVLQDLAANDVLPSEWGGEVEVIRTSAITGQGIDELLETLLVTAELHEYKANPDRPAHGVCLEAEQEQGRGVVAKLMVQQGTLNVGDIVVCGPSHGRIKAMYDTLKPSKKLKDAGPSTPVNITGLDVAPGAGDSFYVLSDISRARELVSARQHAVREGTLSTRVPKISFEDFQRRLQEGTLGNAEEVVTLNLILRADVQGSIEAIEKELSKLEHPEVRVKFLQKSVGGITVADVTLANASQAVILGFNVIPDESARSLAEARGVEIRRYDIIYKVSEDIRAMLEGKLKPEERVVELGRALVKDVFNVRRDTIAGCHVLQGSIQRNCRIRVNRDGRTIGDYGLDTLRRFKEDVKEVPRGMECGIKLGGFNDVKVNDVLEAYKIEEVARTLEAVSSA